MSRCGWRRGSEGDRRPDGLHSSAAASPAGRAAQRASARWIRASTTPSSTCARCARRSTTSATWRWATPLRSSVRRHASRAHERIAAGAGLTHRRPATPHRDADAGPALRHGVLRVLPVRAGACSPLAPGGLMRAGLARARRRSELRAPQSHRLYDSAESYLAYVKSLAEKCSSLVRRRAASVRRDTRLSLRARATPSRDRDVRAWGAHIARGRRTNTSATRC